MSIETLQQILTDYFTVTLQYQ